MKRLPQVGEVWWDGHGVKIGPLEAREGDVYVLWSEYSKRSYTNDGIWDLFTQKHKNNLTHLHTDATGKVINPTFPGGEPMEGNDPKTPAKPPKPDPLILRRDAAKKVLDALEERLTLRDKLKANYADSKALLAREAELKAICEGGGK